MTKIVAARPREQVLRENSILCAGLNDRRFMNENLWKAANEALKNRRRAPQSPTEVIQNGEQLCGGHEIDWEGCDAARRTANCGGTAGAKALDKSFK